MKIEQLEYLVEISHKKSFNRASENLFLTPQALSRSINSMENELGFKIFDRNKKGVRFTPEGEKLLAAAQQITELYTATLYDIQKYQTEMNDLYTGNLLIYAPPSLSLSVLPHIINEFCKEYPNINVCLLEDVSSEILKKLTDNDDPIAANYSRIGLVGLPTENDSISQRFKTHNQCRFVSLHHGKYICCVSKKSNLASNHSISLATIVQYPMIRFTNSSGISSNVQETLLKDYGDPKIVFRTMNMGSWIAAVASNMGVGIFHDIALSEESLIRYEFDNVRALPIKEPVMLETGAIIPNDSNPIIDIFVSHIQSFFEKLH